MTEKTKLHIERLTERNRDALLLIASGAVFNLISSQIQPVSDVAIAMELNLSVPLVRKAIATLEQDQLVVQTYQGDWQCVVIFGDASRTSHGAGETPAPVSSSMINRSSPCG